MSTDMCPTVRRRRSAVRLVLAVLAISIGAFIFACAGGPDAPPGAVHVLTAKGVVNPVMERYLDRGIDAAEDKEAAVVVIRLDTPGGLVSSMTEIVKRILAARVPVVVYVSPPGGRAASAGTFITMSAHVAAMAPSTRIGAAHPIDSSGEDIEGTLNDKVTNDAVALIRGLAERHGRNAEWAESAVRESISDDAEKALELNVIDLIATDLDDLVESIDGREVVLDREQPVAIRTTGAPRVFNNRNFIENFLDIIADPNIAFLLLSLGSLALFIEIINPGQIFPGVFGVIALLLAFFALSVLPFSWAGVALILFAFVLFGLEMFVTSHGILGVGGAVSLLFGGLLLTSDNPPEFQVSRWLVFALSATLGAFVFFIVVNILRIRHMPAQMGMETVVGRHAVVRSTLNPKGYIFIDGEYWSAEAEDGEIRPGESVVITEVNGLQLKVRKQQPEGD
jgi:membrane-bound serine protease (ClpP class)